MLDNLNNIQSHLNKTVDFLEEYSWIYREANTKYVQNEILDNIPEDWANYFNAFPFSNWNEIIEGSIPDNCPESLKKFLEISKSLKFKHELPVIKKSKPIRGVSPKKLHEIQELAALIHSSCKDSDVLVDLGSGLGYLSQYLNENYGYKILGLESDPLRVESARVRQKKYYPNSVNDVKYLAHFITENSMSTVVTCVMSEFGLVAPKVSLIGLHACGDLTITALRLFLQQNETNAIRSLVIMPCCYHKMSLINDNEILNFPLSKTLHAALSTRSSSTPQRPSPFVRPFLRLACQRSAKYWLEMSEHDHQLHGREMFLRSIIEAIASEEGQPWVRKKDSRINANDDYVSILMNSFEIVAQDDEKRSLPWSAKHLDLLNFYLTKYPEGAALSELLTALQSVVQEICESVVLADKLAFLHEIQQQNDNMVCECELKKIVHDKLSPRCYALRVVKQ